MWMINDNDADFVSEDFLDVPISVQGMGLEAGFSEGLLVGEISTSETARAKSALRLKYEAESEVIQKKLGDLEAIRSQLGLSQRKMAQLLLVDPSAWTRWTKGGEQAPPHVFRMLQWYLALEEKYPALDVNFWLSTVSQVNDQARVPELESQLIETQNRLGRLETKFETQFTALNSNLDHQLHTFASSVSSSTLEAFRLEMARKDRETRKLLVWIAASVLASSLVLGVLVQVLTA